VLSLATFGLRISIEITNKRLYKLDFVKRVGITNPFYVARLFSSGYINPARCWCGLCRMFPIVVGGGPTSRPSRARACTLTYVRVRTQMFACSSPLGKILLGGGDGLILTSFPNISKKDGRIFFIKIVSYIFPDKEAHKHIIYEYVLKP
jgi:hypothetical protein